MKFRGLLTAVAGAMLCCFTLGCPPAEEGGAVPSVTEGSESNMTDPAPAVEEPAMEEPAGDDAAEETPAGE